MSERVSMDSRDGGEGVRRGCQRIPPLRVSPEDVKGFSRRVIGSRAGAVVCRLLLAVSAVSGFVPV